MDRFFVDIDQINEENNSILIIGEDVKHISGALRLKENDKLEVVSEGYVYLSEIEKILDGEIKLNILKKYIGENEPIKKVTLYQGLVKGSKMEYVIQKGTEVGINSFYSVVMERSIVRLNNKKIKSRLDRWQKIADEAGKQSKRDIIPKVKDIITFDDMIDKLMDEKNILVPYEAERGNSIGEIFKKINGDNINLIIGPEGGFSDKEIEKLNDIGANTVSLGPRILRTETAGIVAASIIFYEFGDI